jgi:hypothetical protein
VIYETVGLEFNKESKEWDCGFKVWSIQKTISYGGVDLIVPLYREQFLTYNSQ